MRTCPNCRRFLQGETTYCSGCGASLGIATSTSDGFDFDFGGSPSSYQPTAGGGASDFSWDGGAPSISSDSWAKQLSGLPAPRWKRLVGYILDLVLAVLTLGIGWWIWFFIIAGRGQTPAKQLLKLRVIHAHSSGATWVLTVLRYLILSIPGWLFAIVDVFNLVSLPYGFVIIWNIIHVVFWLLPLVDALFILGPRQQRLIDMLLKTQVVNA